jgi:hypothetical protein
VKTKTALVELLKESRDWRTLFKGCANYSAFRLRAQAYRFRDELLERGHGATLDEVQDALFMLARQLLPESPGADFITWAGLLCGDALARIGEHYANLLAEEKEAVDLTRAWETNAEIVAACEAEDLAALREALRSYEGEALAALGRAKEQSGAA